MYEKEVLQRHFQFCSIINVAAGRRRLDVVTQDRALPFPDSLARLKLELERDGFDAKGDIVIDKALTTMSWASLPV